MRPGGLLDGPQPGDASRCVVMAGPNSFGLPPRRVPGSILRSQALPRPSPCRQQALGIDARSLSDLFMPTVQVFLGGTRNISKMHSGEQ